MLVTAVVTTYDRPRLVRRAIQSVLAQTYEPLQIVVVEDGSESGIDAWLREEGLDRVTYVRHLENRGLAAARNTGLNLAEGDYIAYLDDDDEWKPRRIEQQVRWVRGLSESERERLGVVYCGVEVRESCSTRVSRVMWPRNRGNLRDAIVREGAMTLQSTFLFSKDALERVGGFDENLPSSIDHDIWMALASNGYEAHPIDEPLVITYRPSGDRMTASTTPRIQGVRRYVDKWKPTYQEWFGQAGGKAYAERYFADVIGRLAAEKLVNAQFAEAWQATRSLLDQEGSSLYSLAALVKYTARAAAGRLLPRDLVRLLKR